MGNVKVLDISGIPFVVEKREEGFFIIGIRQRKRVFKFDSSAIPAAVVEKLISEDGDGKISGIKEFEEFLEGINENEKLSDKVPDEFATDNEIESQWESIMQEAINENHQQSGE